MSDPVHLLVVDDEPDLELLIRQKFRRQIRDGRMQFTFAGDGVEALERIADDPAIEIVLTDINMPRMDGLSLLGRIREMDRLLKVVIVSAYGDIDNIRTAMNRGAFDFITKPIQFEDFEITIEKTHAELTELRKAVVLQQQLSALHRELEIASKIQLSMLPSAFPAFPERPEFSLYATMIPAQEVGGDFYDCFLIDDDRLGFVLGDVSGKGVGAALFMAITRTMLRATALGGLPVDACVRHVNRVLQPESMPNMFVTLVYGLLDLKTGAAAFCNAGHHPPCVLRAGGRLEVIQGPRSLGLCLAKDFDYAAAELTLHAGDTVFLYTDGVTEAVDGARAQFEEERLYACLDGGGGRGPAEVIRRVLRAVEEFSGGAAQADDITMLALQYAG